MAKKKPTRAAKSQTPKRGRGKPPHIPTEQTRYIVKVASASGIDQKHIARFIGIGESTLKRRYKHELDNGAMEAFLSVHNAYYRQAAGAPAQYDQNNNRIREEIEANPAITRHYIDRFDMLQGRKLRGGIGVGVNKTPDGGTQINVTIAPEDAKL